METTATLQRDEGETQDHCQLLSSMAYWTGTCPRHLNREREIWREGDLRYGTHTKCFPVVNACSNSITQHLSSYPVFVSVCACAKSFLVAIFGSDMTQQKPNSTYYTWNYRKICAINYRLESPDLISCSGQEGFHSDGLSWSWEGGLHETPHEGVDQGSRDPPPSLHLVQDLRTRRSATRVRVSLHVKHTHIALFDKWGSSLSQKCVFASSGEHTRI